MGASMGAVDTPRPEHAIIGELIQEVQPGEEAWRELEKLVGQRSRRHLRHYKYMMHIRKLFRILPSEILQGYREEATRQNLGPPQLLFHGTTPANAERILFAGFEVPKREGGLMFGPGIYFAKDPLKSVRYAPEGAQSPAVSQKSSPKPAEHRGLEASATAWLEALWQRAFGSGAEGNVRHMLACEVYLGKSRTLRSPKPKFEPAKGLRRNSLLKALGAEKYDSVRAPGGAFGCVRVTEYVVYQECQAIPRFLIEFEQVPVARR